MDDGGRPLDVLESKLGADVTARLKDGETYHGTLTGYDQHLNLVLEPPAVAEEPFPDEPTATSVEGTTVIRGDNVVTVEL